MAVKEPELPSPLSVKKNDYLTNPKRSDIPTPRWLCDWLHRTISPVYPAKVILDPSAGATGNPEIDLLAKAYETASTPSRRYNAVLKIMLLTNNYAKTARILGIVSAGVCKKIYKAGKDLKGLSYGWHWLEFEDDSQRRQRLEELTGAAAIRASEALDGVWLHYEPGESDTEQFVGCSYPGRRDKIFRKLM